MSLQTLWPTMPQGCAGELQTPWSLTWVRATGSFGSTCQLREPFLLHLCFIFSSPFSQTGFVLEGTAPWELPECLIGALRLEHLEVKVAKPLDTEKEIPLL